MMRLRVWLPLFFGVGLLCLFLPVVAEAYDFVRGIYGVPSIGKKDPVSYMGSMKKAGVNAVFVPTDEKTVRYFKDRGFEVYVSVNAFGGKGAWKRYPDCRPVKSDGTYLGSEPGYKGYGGVCPTHPAWRQDRLNHIENLVKKFGGEEGIDGIWLDFIRYPGLWEVPDPKIPDTCYCPRCLSKFQKDTGTKMPEDLDAKGAAAWIKANKPYQWMTWKKQQIDSFVSETREVMKRNQGKKTLRLGLFLVPWTKGERDDAISYLLAQDPFELAKQVDVISPMVYHKMCGKPAEWVGYMCDYYRETAEALVWPIVEAQSAPQLNTPKGTPVQRGKESIAHSGEDRGKSELGEVMRYAGEGGADGILAFSFGKMTKGDLWDGFQGFKPVPNLVGEAKSAERMAHGAPRLNTPEGTPVQRGRERKTEGAENAAHSVWSKACGEKETRLTAKDEWGEEWVVPLGSCEPGKEYVFRGEFWRDGWQNGVYPTVSIWGKEFLVDTHLKAKEWQPIRVNVVCPNKVKDPNFRFINRNRDTTFRLRHPTLERIYRFRAEPAIPVAEGFFPGRFFPIGVYGARLENLEQIKRLAVNTVIIGGSGEDLKKKVERCHEVGLRYVLSVPHDPDRLKVYLDEIADYARPYDMAFYVNDEPGIWSFPVNKANDINRLIKGRFPECATCMAVVRPQVCGDYAQTADFFMLDQYPVPFMPMTWLGDCMGECAKGLVNGYSLLVNGEEKEVSGYSLPVNRSKEPTTNQAIKNNDGPRIKNTQITNNATKRLAAVIQAFGGERWKDVGWPRVPTEREMNCLAFLSVVHGARGIFFRGYALRSSSHYI